MDDTDLKLRKIKEIVDNFNRGIRRKPQLLGSVEEIESSFFWIDQINIILTYGAEACDKGLMWKSFLNFKGIGGTNENAAKTIMSSDNPYVLLKQMRNEYDRWVEMKISHKNSPADSPLIGLLEKTDERGADELLPWFAKYPSGKAMDIYSARINYNYIDNPGVAIGLAGMGDGKVLEWAAGRIKITCPCDEKRLALQCIASSPLDSADNIVREIIESDKTDDIDGLLSGFSYECSMSRHRFERIEQIMMLPERALKLKTSIHMALISMRHQNREKCHELLKKMGVED